MTEVLRSGNDCLDLIGEAMGNGEEWVVLPVERLDESFFQLKTGVAGDIVQKFVNYRIRLAIIGDISRHIAASDAFRDFVTESNRGRQLWFLPTMQELDAKRGPVTPDPAAPPRR